MEDLIDKLIDDVLSTLPNFFDNPNGGHIYTCPFCSASKEVDTKRTVFTADLKHDADCTYVLAQTLYKLRE
jgi:hypothetical protein